jgi:hypothetical protein
MRQIGITRYQHAGMPDVGQVEWEREQGRMSRRIAFHELTATQEQPSGTVLSAKSGANRPQSDEASVRGRRASLLAPSRRGRKALTVHLDADTHVRLKVMAAQQVTTLEALAAEAIELLFANRRDRAGSVTGDRRDAEMS